MNKLEILLPLVSIIVPVYNVEDFLERCLESIVNQTYSRLEIIIVNDGSADGSGRLCRSWKRQEKRIILIEQDNQGLGPARNSGLQEATGEYIAFVDSDDWLEPTYIEEMVQAALEQRADMVICDYRKVWEDRRFQIVKAKLSADRILDGVREEELIFYAGTLLWNKLYRREVICKADVIQPADAVEDMCVSYLYTANAERILYIRRQLYNYAQRSGSLINGERAFRNLKGALERIGGEAAVKLNRWKDSYYLKKMVSDGIVYYEHLHPEEKEEAGSLKQLFIENYCKNGETLPGLLNGVVFGSFNLRNILKEILFFLPEYYGFSSLISVMQPRQALAEPSGRAVNSFRQDLLDKELKRSLLKEIREKDYLFIDFLEERFDLAYTDEAGWLTLSGRLKEEPDGVKTRYRIANDSPQFKELWQESCARFVELLKKEWGSGHKIQIFLVRMRMCEKYGEYRAENSFVNIEEIACFNQRIEEREQYFLERCPGVKTIDIPREYLYADADGEYGCYPWYVNGDCLKYAADEIRRRIYDTLGRRGEAG